MHCHILGICGTFMAGVALLARESGHRVTGSDAGVYPPMSTMLDDHGIEVREGYLPDHLEPAPDCVVIGNALSRGNPAVELVLELGLDYTSGPEWLRRHVLRHRTVLAVAGTHGKTTTASILAWILESAGLEPGFLIGGKPGNFDGSARLGAGDPFVVEADEYDTAFFDKRSKFVHYRPRVAVLNNLEFDHADIFEDLGQIRRQFHHLVRTVPGNGRLIVNGRDRNLEKTLAMGCWTPVETFSTNAPEGAGDWAEWHAEPQDEACSRFAVLHGGQPVGAVAWQVFGRHNMSNALAAVAAASAVGVAPEQACAALASFVPPVKRLQLLHESGGILLYEDFAHHPTAIRLTLETLRSRHPGARLVALFEPRSNTMRMGGHGASLAEALAKADLALVYHRDDLQWNPAWIPGDHARALNSTDRMLSDTESMLESGVVLVVMSNGDFEGLAGRLRAMLEARNQRSPATAT